MSAFRVGLPIRGRQPRGCRSSMALTPSVLPLGWMAIPYSVVNSSRCSVADKTHTGPARVIASLSIAAISGVVTALAFAPIGIWPLALLGVVGVLAAQWRGSSLLGAAV